MIREAASALVTLLVFMVFCSPAMVEPAAMPNFLFIFADDQCYDTVNSLGNDEIQTPHLARIVALEQLDHVPIGRFARRNVPKTLLLPPGFATDADNADLSF